MKLDSRVFYHLFGYGIYVSAPASRGKSDDCKECIVWWFNPGETLFERDS